MDKFLNITTKENIEGPSPKRKRGPSCVWQHFKKTEDKTKATCAHCGKTLKTAGNTSNLLDHLKRIHPNYNVCEVDNQSPRLDSYMQRNVEYPSDSQQKKKLDKYVMLMIARDVQPFSMVDDDGFRDLIQNMDPKYRMPSRTYFRDIMLPKLYNELRKDLECELEGVPYVAITTDGWTSRANEAYITVTCHFVNKKFELVSAALSTANLVTPTNHSAVNIADTLRQILNEWDLLHKVVTIVTDNDVTMKKACQHLEITHFPCFAHTINLLVQEILKMEIIRPILTKCKAVVAFIKRSSTAMAKFREAQMVTDPLGLVQEVPTRWNSAFQMIERILQTKEALSIALLGTAKAPAQMYY
ncbi:zinc finger BED domain-containing protein 4-like [Drosophila takahashii]|uniref:zinc finger BED domain-containing protein 4-like n=1 Tax=Drosophila takahashii TaxID=29030 RepID=UPI003898FDA3